MAGTTTARPPDLPLRVLLLLASLAGCIFASGGPSPAKAEPAWLGVPARPSQSGTGSARLMSGQNDPAAQMLVQANEINYDYTNERVSAAGNVQIHYLGSILEAERVVYDQKTKRMHAEGNVRLTESDGKVVRAERLDLNESFRDGFVDSLHVETADKTRIVAPRAERGEGRYTVFQSGVYTACEPCKDNPQRPPKWQVKAARILHDEAEKTIYFEDARVELFGLPIMYFPYFWSPDPSVKKKTGLLMPWVFSGTKYGLAVQTPFFWNLAPDYDVTLSPMVTSRQGPLMIAEWRQHLVNGAYNIRAAGIFQQDKNWFLVNEGPNSPGYRDFRGAVESKGDFRLSEKWFWGWDASLFTDSGFPADYKVIKPGVEQAVSQLYLFGRGEKSYFDARMLHFYGLTPLDVQRQLPVVHPLIEYKYVYGQPVFGGELGYNINVTSLSRNQADFDPITQAAADNGWCAPGALPATLIRANCLLRGIPGTYSRVSAEAYWRRTFIDSFGQVFTPFASLRADLAAVSVSPQPGVGNFINTGDSSLARVTPAVGLEYRYPFISVHSWGTQTIEPVAQIIARPNETQIGRFPNEDSQSLIFDDANLFQISKFSGRDRVEGGGRANVGLQYTAQFNDAGYVNGLFGQSYHLFGVNSYAVPDMVNSGIQSGLETPRSDYVARLTYQPNKTYAFLSRFRFDEHDFSVRRMELEGKVNFDRWSAGVMYGSYDAQTSASLLVPREAVAPSVALKVTPNWSIGAGALYSIDSSRLNTSSFTVGYIDECIAINAIYQSNYGYRGDIVPNRVFMLQINLRTLGGTSFNQTIGGPGNTSGNSLGF